MNATRETIPGRRAVLGRHRPARPEAAVDFYGGLFGWEFDDRTPPTVGELRYFVARLRGRDVAGDRLACRGTPSPRRGTPTSRSRAPTRPRRRSPRRAARCVMDPFDVSDAGRMAVLADPPGRGVLRLAGGSDRGRAARQRARHLELQRPQHAATPRARSPSTARCSAGRRPDPSADGDGGLVLAPARATATSSTSATPARASAWRRMGAPEGFEDAVAWLTQMTDEQFPAEAPPHWGDHLRGRRRRRDREARAQELGGTILVPSRSTRRGYG